MKDLELHAMRLQELYYQAVGYTPGAEISDIQTFIRTVGAFNAHLEELLKGLDKGH